MLHIIYKLLGFCIWPLASLFNFGKLLFETSKKQATPSVNFHFTRECNYKCGFCFHTEKTSHLTPLPQAKIGLKKLKDHGMKKLNFSGGEPFLHAPYLGELCKFAKEVLHLDSVSIVSNGSRIKKQFFQIYGKYIDILAISVDSFNEDTNVLIGRGKGRHLEQLNSIADWCQEYGVMFKLNTVVNKFNHLEDFTAFIEGLAPIRWKCFQVLPVETENIGESSKRDCSKFLITTVEFEDFCRRHEHLTCFVPESNAMMKSSYLILDEYMRFLNKGDKYAESASILDVSVDEALLNTDYQPDIFVARGGIYNWQRDNRPSCGRLQPELEF